MKKEALIDFLNPRQPQPEYGVKKSHFVPDGTIIKYIDFFIVSIEYFQRLHADFDEAIKEKCKFIEIPEMEIEYSPPVIHFDDANFKKNIVTVKMYQEIIFKHKNKTNESRN